MDAKRTFTPEQLHYLRLLSKQYPTVQAAGTEIINLRAILNLPKGTEHFMSDIHGEHEAFLHILNSCSGEVKDKLDELFGATMTQRDRNDLATLIYYPSAKLALVSYAKEHDIPIICSMGTGNKLHPELFKIADIYKTNVCPLCRVMRRELKKRDIAHLKVLYSEEIPHTPQAEGEEKSSGRPAPASIAFVPPVAGLIIAGEVIREISGVS